MATPRPVRTQWVKREELKPEPVDMRAQKAAHLPMPGPGIVVTVPLHLLPEYLDLYRLEPLDQGVPPRPFKPVSILLVKRVPREGK